MILKEKLHEKIMLHTTSRISKKWYGQVPDGKTPVFNKEWEIDTYKKFKDFKFID